ncbi:MAG: hypothetical protein JNJ58_03740 [Chitinophagaceae bacterium]|nr:hypothetical protein [Chitinophagaceae bacterium]
METINLLHSILRYAVLAVMIYAIARAFMGMQKSSPFTAADSQAGLFTTIICDIQLLLGLALYFIGPLGLKNIQNNGMGYVMKDSYSRFFAVEHITGMLIALALVHIGKAKSKKKDNDAAKHKTAFVYYLIALIIILASIPWPFRKGFEGIGWS